MYLRNLLVIALALLVLEAEARTVNLSGRKIEIAPPSGYCLLDASRPAEAEIMRITAAGMGDGNQLLDSFADCVELDQLRGGRRTKFDNFGQIVVQSLRGKPAFISGASSREEFIRKIGGMPASSIAETTERTKNVVAQVNRALSEGSISMKAQEPHWLNSDRNAAYWAILAQVVYPNGQKANLLGVTGATLVKNMSFSILIYRNFSGPPPIEILLLRQQAAMAALVSANQ